MSMTPLTDAQLVRVYGKTGEVCAATPTCGHPTYVPADFARSLERMAAERDEYARWRQDLADKLDEVERHRDAIGRALNKRENDLMLLRNAVDAMMATLGYQGEISAMDDRAQAVMDALAKIDAMEAK